MLCFGSGSRCEELCRHANRNELQESQIHMGHPWAIVEHVLPLCVPKWTSLKQTFPPNDLMEMSKYKIVKFHSASQWQHYEEWYMPH